jgi:hypothetical protein
MMRNICDAKIMMEFGFFGLFGLFGLFSFCFGVINCLVTQEVGESLHRIIFINFLRHKKLNDAKSDLKKMFFTNKK